MYIRAKNFFGLTFRVYLISFSKVHYVDYKLPHLVTFAFHKKLLLLRLCISSIYLLSTKSFRNLLNVIDGSLW